MYPLFIAEGPAFKKNFHVDSFRNVDVYPLMCSILDVQPALNNGSFDIVKTMLNRETKKSIECNLFSVLTKLFQSFRLYLQNLIYKFN